MKEKKQRPNEQLKQAREARGLTQEQAAEHLNIGDRTLRRLEGGGSAHPGTISRLVEFYGKSRGELGLGKECPPRKPPDPSPPLEQQRECGQEVAPPIVSLTKAPSSTNSKQIKPSAAQSNRQRFLRRVRKFWIDGVLELSLHGAVLIALGLQEQLDALANPWYLVLQHPDTAPRMFPLGTRITEVYDAVEGELLILGAPGSGKTTLLLELARELLERAEREEQLQLPVVFNLSSWATKQQPLADWLVEELSSTYLVPRKLGQAWVESDQILPMLDGLDEVATKDCMACIKAINAYRQEHGLLPLVVCSRSADYLAQTVRLRLNSAVVVQPLTDQQVDDYLTRGGEPLWALRVALQQDTELRELTSTPLMLSILTLTYHGMPVEDLLRGGVAPTLQQVFEHYVKRMHARRGVSKHVPREQMLKWLTFLATQMQQHHQTIFYLEHLQADWLDRHLLYRLSVCLVFGLVCGLLTGLLDGLSFGLGNGLTVGLGNGLLIGLVCGLLTGLCFGLGRIHPKEVLTCSWRGTKRSIIGGLAIWLAVWLAIWLIIWLIQGLPFGLVGGLVCGLACGLAFGLASGFSANQLDDRSRLTPNQGIWRSASNGLVCGLLIGLLIGLVCGLLYGLVVGLGVGLIQGLLVGPAFWLAFGVFFGLGAFLQHFTLRFWLWRTDCLPWNLVAFLDEAAERLLLRKVGGGYIFVHRLLLEYFASLNNTPPLAEAVCQELCESSDSG